MQKKRSIKGGGGNGRKLEGEGSYSATRSYNENLARALVDTCGIARAAPPTKARAANCLGWVKMTPIVEAARAAPSEGPVYPWLTPSNSRAPLQSINPLHACKVHERVATIENAIRTSATRSYRILSRRHRASPIIC